MANGEMGKCEGAPGRQTILIIFDCKPGSPGVKFSQLMKTTFSPDLPEALRDRCRAVALAICDWCVRTQVRSHKPCFDANNGRFIYTHYLPGNQTVPGIGWTQARAIMILLSAWNGTDNPVYLESALLAGLYLRSTQDVASPHPARDGVIYEEMPQSHHIYPRDAAEVAEAMLYLGQVTGDPEWAWRADRFGRWFIRQAVNESGWPLRDVFPDDRPGIDEPASYQIGNGKLFARLMQAKTPGNARWRRALTRIVKGTMDDFISPEGAICAHPRHLGDAASKDIHHAGSGAEAHLTLNDDGAGIVLLMAHQMRLGGTARYKLGPVLARYTEWIRTRKTPLPKACAFPAMANLMLDWHRQTGDRAALDWVLENLETGLFSLQFNTSGHPMQGALRGEDELPEWYYGGKSSDYVCMRTNAYAAMVLFKLCGGNFWGPGYSAFGWNELRRASVLPTREHMFGNKLV